jgi:tRNA threonylcarbamoyladenosine biosynthesis protein TsaE
VSDFVIQTLSAEETVSVGHRLAGVLRVGDLVALAGPLGAGKTQLTRGIAAGLGMDPRQVASPTFIMMSEYEGPTPLVHIDAYRIHSLSDLETIGFTRDLIERSITVVEWADRIAADLPQDHLWIALDHTEARRAIAVTCHGDLARRRSQVAGALQGPANGGSGQRLEPPPESSFTCRTCGRQVSSGAATYPFCSERCRLADLNKWFTGSYSISQPLDPGDPDE